MTSVRKLIPLVLLGSISLNTNAQVELKNGDLLFNVTNVNEATDFSRSIVESTKGVNEAKVNHVAIVCQEDSGLFVIEATNKHGVWMCPIETYLDNADKTEDGRPMVIVGRVKADVDFAASIQNAKAYIGKNYDFIFSPTDEEMYCSELVQKSYVDKQGKLIFEPIPMSFHDEEGTILPFWFEYYEKRGLDVPEGEPGSNPGALSRDKNVEIIDTVEH
ncbi:MAG: hypothetical protein KBT33_12630 [Prevotellaceae bacterium]|nr:hypothetical protein [Candidatus Minthosoma equi]